MIRLIREWRQHRAATVLLKAYWGQFPTYEFRLKTEDELAVERFLYRFWRKATPCIPPPCPPVEEYEISAITRCVVHDRE